MKTTTITPERIAIGNRPKSPAYAAAVAECDRLSGRADGTYVTKPGYAKAAKECLRLAKLHVAETRRLVAAL